MAVQNILSEVFGEEFPIMLPEVTPTVETAKMAFDAASELKIVPNPTEGNPITIYLPDDVAADGGSLALYGPSGKLVKAVSCGDSKSVTLGVDGLPNGLYMCILHGKGNALLARSKIAVIR